MQVRQAVTLEVALDGVHFSRNGLVFTYYDMQAVQMVAALTPSGGPRLGGTTVSVAGTGFADFGARSISHGLQCQFGRPSWMAGRYQDEVLAVSRARMDPPNGAACVTPQDPAWLPSLEPPSRPPSPPAPQHGQSAPLAVPQLGPFASSEHAWRLQAARYSQGEAAPLGTQPLPRVLELAASKAAYFPAFDRTGAGYVPEP